MQAGHAVKHMLLVLALFVAQVPASLCAALLATPCEMACCQVASESGAHEAQAIEASTPSHCAETPSDLESAQDACECEVQSGSSPTQPIAAQTTPLRLDLNALVATLPEPPPAVSTVEDFDFQPTLVPVATGPPGLELFDIPLGRAPPVLLA